MIKNYVKRQVRYENHYYRRFYVDDNGGFSFPCDENGNVLPFEYDAARKNYEDAMAHPEKFVYWNEFVCEKRRVVDSAHGTCKCGQEVYLFDHYRGACECPNCGQWYNMFGQELLPPSEWEENWY